MSASLYYRVKMFVVRPYVWYMRRKMNVDHPLLRAYFETNWYRPDFIKFFQLSIDNKDILKTAPLDGQSIVFDIGAFDGKWSQRVLELHNNPTIHAFEPSPTAIKRAQNLLHENPQFHLHPYGLSDENERVTFYNAELGSSSFQKDNNRNTVEVQLRNVAEVIDELQIEHIDLIKINIEGGEYPLMRRLIETGHIKACNTILIQYHEWIPRAHAMRRQINRDLARTHDVVWSYNFVWEKWQRKPDT